MVRSNVFQHNNIYLRDLVYTLWNRIPLKLSYSFNVRATETMLTHLTMKEKSAKFEPAVCDDRAGC